MAASSGFRLTQEPDDQTGVVLYRALYDGVPEPGRRLAALRGVVFVTLRMQQSTEAALRQLPAYLRWCLVDTHPAATRPRLAGPAGCERRPPDALHREAAVLLGGQRWQLRLDARRDTVPEAGHGNAWLFSTVGLLSAAMLSPRPRCRRRSGARRHPRVRRSGASSRHRTGARSSNGCGP